MLEYVGKETLDMLAAEAGIDFDNDLASSKEGAGAASETYNEDVSFDHCFIIYGGPEHLEVSFEAGKLTSPFFSFYEYWMRNANT